MASEPDRREEGAAATTESPQLLRARQSTENAWLRIQTEFGLLTQSEVAELLGSTPTDTGLASALRAAHEIAGVVRGETVRYPGFQFDRDHG